MNIKACCRCKIVKPATNEFFSRNKRAKDGLYHECKVCRAERAKTYYAANKEKMNDCTRKWRAANPERAAEIAHSYHVNNLERRTETARQWREANHERHVNNKHAYYLANKERHAEYNRTWHANHPGTRRVYNHVTRARKCSAEGTHTAADIKAQYKAQEGLCYYCKCEVGDIYHVDHIVPFSRGGTDWPKNLVIACPTCNTSKSDKLPHEWMQSRRNAARELVTSGQESTPVLGMQR